MWNLKGKLCGTFAGHTGHVRSCVFSRDGELLATASQDKTAKVHTLTHTHPLTLCTGYVGLECADSGV